jgi:hypothetical protein
VAVFFVAAAVLVPAVGIVGYGLAEVVSLAPYALMLASVKRFIPLSSWRAVPWLVAFIPPLLGPWVGMRWAIVLWIVPIAVLCSPRVRAQLASWRASLRLEPA